MKVSKFNPKDTTLDEIHAIQETHYEQQKNWDFQKLQAYYHQIVEKVSKETGTEIRTVTQDSFVTKN